jgi:toxoflavin biosynthesis protein ToxD
MPEPVHVAPPDRFPARLASLGYHVTLLNGAEIILPPLCDIPAGPFLMGSDTNKEKDAQEFEEPQHWMTLPAFQIGKYAVTVAEYACFVRAGQREPYDWHEQRGKLDYPVVTVSWYDSVAYVTWLAANTGQPWRLPTEAEWEKTARGTDGRIYPWGNVFDARRANTSEGSRGEITPVGTYPTGSSPYGAQDMAGNVWEWTSSLWKPYPYSTADGREAAKSDESRVLRGGCWFNGASGVRAACRNRNLPLNFNPGSGFRLVLAALSPDAST